jgi:hypothetical protein
MQMTMQVVSFNRHYFAIAFLACAGGIGLVMLWMIPPCRRCSGSALHPRSTS